jgi:hypothetical protein
MQRRARCNHDRKRDEVRKSHPDEGVQMNPVNRSLALMRRPLQDLPGRDRPDVLGFLGSLPKEQVRADGGAEDGNNGRQVILVPTDGTTRLPSACPQGTFTMKRHAT